MHRTTGSRRWLPVAAAAAAVVVIALVAATYLTPRPRTNVGSQPTAPTTTAPVRTAPPTVVVPTANVPDVGTIQGLVPLNQAVNGMVAASANAAPMTLGADELLYQRSDWYEVDPGPGTPEGGRIDLTWYDPEGFAILRMIRNGHDVGNAPSGELGFSHPTPAWLAQVSTDPVQLYAVFAAMNANTKNGGDRYVSKEIIQVFRAYGPMLPPGLRAALFRVLGMVQGEEVRQVTVDGHTYYGFMDTSSARPEFAGYLLCDPATGQAVGIRYRTGDIELWHFAAVDSVDEMP